MRSGTLSLLFAAVLSFLQPTLGQDFADDSDGDNPRLYMPSGRRAPAIYSAASYAVQTEGSLVIRSETPLAAAHDGNGAVVGAIERRWTAQRQGAMVGAAAATGCDRDEGVVAVVGQPQPQAPEALAQLLGLALEHCRERGDLKVSVTAPMADAVIQRVAAEHGFLFGRQRRDGDVPFVELYANLYWQPPRQGTQALLPERVARS